MATKYTLASINVRGLRDKTKRDLVYNWINENNIDIGLFQETFYDKDNNVKYKYGLHGELYHSFTQSSHARGVSIFICSP